jgi:hypothetical protein
VHHGGQTKEAGGKVGKNSDIETVSCDLSCDKNAPVCMKGIYSRREKKRRDPSLRIAQSLGEGGQAQRPGERNKTINV